MRLFLKRPDAEEIKVNWLQDIGPIYPNDDYMPHVLIHNPKTKKGYQITINFQICHK